MYTRIYNIILLFILIILIYGCSDNKSISTLPSTHPKEWIDPQSADFHGKVVSDHGSKSCEKCHGVDFEGGISDVSCLDCHLASGACMSCHGGTDNNTGAPPRGLNGETDPSNIAVGAHTGHVENEITNNYDCVICHIKPINITDPTHMDGDNIAEVVFGSIAGNSAEWDRIQAKCNNVYCHGNFDGGNHINPSWINSDQANCGSCHDVGSQPALLLWEHEFHISTARIRCEKCHGNVVDINMNISNLDLHINGQIDTLTSDIELCNSCHGSSQTCTGCHGGLDNQSGAPPYSLDGSSSTTIMAVGAHTSHINGNLLSDGIPCSECHIVPDGILNFGHLGDDGVAEINFGSLAGASSNWNRSTANCSQVYCHGNFDGGYISNSPNWISSNQAQCGSCHDAGSNPADLSGRHRHHVQEENVMCYRCHANTVNSSLNIVGKDLHINGTVEVVFSSGNGTYSNGQCSNTGCHGTESW